MSDTEYYSNTGGTNNNFNGKNAHIKVDFNIYNVADVNTDTDVGDTIGTGDASDISRVNNNIDNKNVYAKAGFSTYNVKDVNAGANMGLGNTSCTVEKVSNNRNNTGESQSSRMGGANRGRLGGTNKSKPGGIDIKAGVEVGGGNKGGMDEAYIEAGKKASVGVVASTNNSSDSGGKVTD